MSIDNISRIQAKGDKNRVYLFDIPSTEDEDALITYLLIVSKDGKVTIKRLVDFNNLFSLLHDSKTVSIKYHTKEYDTFIQKMAVYMESIENNKDESTLEDQDIDIITSQYKLELKRKGNTDVLKRK
ncbi:MAG: hypothetical protein J6O56_02550 [Bacilli bacterium]|nr:hypothetical protein [Bacilli bacterium]